MKKWILWLLVIGSLLGCSIWHFLVTRDAGTATAQPTDYRYKALSIATAHIARMEKPDAKSVYLADTAAEQYAPYLEHAGLVCATNHVDEGHYKLVLAAGKNPNWKKLLKKTTEQGVLAYAIDVREMTAAQFQKLLKTFPCAEARLWMPGENDWLLTGRRVPTSLKLDVLLDAFSPDGAIGDLAVAQCDSLPQIYANYVGSREELLPAFQGDLNVPIRAAALIPVEIPSCDWLVPGETDEDIAASVKQEIQRLQKVRRLICEGHLLSLQPGGIEKAIDKWAEAYQQNPGDIMLLDRLYRLAVNARAFENIGNLKGAAACYETMIAVRPKDAAVMMRYAECMRKLGYKEIAEAAAKRARELMR